MGFGGVVAKPLVVRVLAAEVVRQERCIEAAGTAVGQAWEDSSRCLYTQESLHTASDGSGSSTGHSAYYWKMLAGVAKK